MGEGRGEVDRVAVVGAGLMGHGIAQALASSGSHVGLHDVSAERLDAAMAAIADNLGRLAASGAGGGEPAGEVLERIRPTTDLAEAVSGARFVAEAAFEDLAVKHELFREMDRLCAPPAVLASNTSSFQPSRLAEAVGRPERLVIAHWFNPPHLVPLVEVVPGPRTDEATVGATVARLERAGKRPVVLRREAVGFVANRLQMALYREALAIVGRGIADPEAVDLVVRHGFGRRLAAAGPFEVFDLAGLDTILAVSRQIMPDLESAPGVPEALAAKVAEGALGVKAGRGFRDWPPEAAEDLRGRLERALRDPGREP